MLFPFKCLKREKNDQSIALIQIRLTSTIRFRNNLLKREAIIKFLIYQKKKDGLAFLR